jgi:hypothetical protein
MKFQDFTMLLAAPYALWKNADFFSTPVVSIGNAQKHDREKVRDFLEKMYKITNYDDTVEYLQHLKVEGANQKYHLYLADWQEKPILDKSGMDEKLIEHYEDTKKFAEQLAPCVGEYGFAAYDCALAVDICREAHTCGYFSEQVALEYANDFAKIASELFPNWEQYAISFLAGCAYDVYYKYRKAEEAENYFKHMLGIVIALFKDERYNVWNKNRFERRVTYFKNLQVNARHFDENLYCIVSDEVSVHGKQIGLMFREIQEKVNEEVIDTGWRFCSGKEDEDYVKNLDNFKLLPLNIVCNYDPEILKFIDSDENTVFERKDGVLQEVEYNE